ncbi:MAG: deoxyribodipyrimidine photo-lyase, partial [Methanolinea sp.]
MIAAERVHTLNTARVRKGRYVLYWMQSSHRASSNLALEHAIERANNLGIPVLACFCFDVSYPGANERHFQFLAEGLIAVGRALEERGIQLILMRGTPGEVIPDLASEAALVVTDTGYLALHLTWRKAVARQISCPLIQVEDNVVVPVKIASVKEEWSAGTIRMKLHRLITRFLEQVEPARVDSSSLSLDAGGLAYEEARSLPREAADRSVAPSAFYRGGEDEAARRLDSFISHDLDRYGTLRSDPALNVISNMSPYLHYGQISPVRIAQRVLESGKAGADAFLDELIVRRELSM